MIDKAGPTPEGKEEAAPYQRIGREGFDENVYQQVKPVIQKVYNDSVANKRTIKDFITTLHARYGNQIRPYVKRFVKDLRAARAIERLTRNAYRVLGLRASASQAAIHNAAGSMRRALKLGAAKTTAWDLCWLGALNRAESDIQDAVGRLTNPTQRLYERLFWFHEGEDVVRGLSLASLENTAAGWSSAPRPAARHDAAVLHLLAAVLLDPEVKKESLWLGVFSEWKLVVESDDYWSALIDAEMTSDFEPTATVEEVEKVREETLRLVANILVVIARDALTRDELALCQRTFHVFRMAGLSDDHLSDLENEILEPVEDSFEALCTEVRRQCSDNIRQDDKSAQTNRLVCEPAVARFDTEVEPQLKRIVELAGSDSAVGHRARESAARCLHSLAIDWTWTDDFIGAESLLLRGRTLAGDTSAVVRFDEELERIAASVQQQKSFLEEPKPTEEQKRTEEALNSFVALCVEVRSGCGNKVKHDDESASANRAVCEAAVTRFDTEVEPQLKRILELVGTDGIGAFRGWEAAALCLYGLAIDYTWAEEFVTAEKLLARAKALTPSGSVVLSRIEESLASVGKQARQERVWKNLKPISRAPSLQTINGFGFSLYGRTDDDPESGSYLTTYYFVALFIPILPICRYRVINAGNSSYRFLGKAPLRAFDRWHLGLVLAGFLAFVTLANLDVGARQQGFSLPSPGLGLPNNSATPTPWQSPLPPPTSPRFDKREETLRSLKDKIDIGRMLISATEENLKIARAELNSLAKKIEGDKSKITRYEQQYHLGLEVETPEYQRTLREHNSLVDQYNQKLSEYQKDYADYEKGLEQDKRLVEEYNTLVRR